MPVLALGPAAHYVGDKRLEGRLGDGQLKGDIIFAPLQAQCSPAKADIIQLQAADLNGSQSPGCRLGEPWHRCEAAWRW